MKAQTVLSGGVGGRDPPVGERTLVLTGGQKGRERVLSMAPVESKEERIVTERGREANVVSIRQS